MYGHRHDVEGFHEALKQIDAAVARWLEMLRDGDLLVLTADHGVDPDAPHTDHTREYSPLLAVFAGTTGAATTGRSRTWGRASPALAHRPRRSRAPRAAFL